MRFIFWIAMFLLIMFGAAILYPPFGGYPAGTEPVTEASPMIQVTCYSGAKTIYSGKHKKVSMGSSGRIWIYVPGKRATEILANCIIEEE
jgi:hypothetical protein